MAAELAVPIHLPDLALDHLRNSICHRASLLNQSSETLNHYSTELLIAVNSVSTHLGGRLTLIGTQATNFDVPKSKCQSSDWDFQITPPQNTTFDQIQDRISGFLSQLTPQPSHVSQDDVEAGTMLMAYHGPNLCPDPSVSLVTRTTLRPDGRPIVGSLKLVTSTSFANNPTGHTPIIEIGFPILLNGQWIPAETYDPLLTQVVEIKDGVCIIKHIDQATKLKDTPPFVRAAMDMRMLSCSKVPPTDVPRGRLHEYMDPAYLTYHWTHHLNPPLTKIERSPAASAFVAGNRDVREHVLPSVLPALARFLNTKVAHDPQYSSIGDYVAQIISQNLGDISGLAYLQHAATLVFLEYLGETGFRGDIKAEANRRSRNLFTLEANLNASQRH